MGSSKVVDPFKNTVQIAQVWFCSLTKTILWRFFPCEVKQHKDKHKTTTGRRKKQDSDVELSKEMAPLKILK